MTILVTGATGNVGANVVRVLVARGVPVRAFVRDRDKALPMLGDRTDLLVGDLADTDAIHRAVQGVDRVFLACGNVPGQVQYECAVIDAAKDAGVTRVVKLSSPRPALDSPLVFDRWHAEIERHLVRSGLRSVMLRPRTYMTNVLGYAEGIAQTGRIFAPAGAARISFIDPRDVAAAAAAALTADEPLSEIYTLTGPESIGFDRVAAELSTATGRTIEYVDVPDEAAHQAMLDAGLPAMAADFIVGLFQSQRAGSMTSTTDDVRELIDREPRTFRQFAQDNASAFGVKESVGTGAVGQ